MEKKFKVITGVKKKNSRVYLVHFRVTVAISIPCPYTFLIFYRKLYSLMLLDP